MKLNCIDPNLAPPSADGTSFVFYDAHHLTLEGFPSIKVYFAKYTI